MSPSAVGVVFGISPFVHFMYCIIYNMYLSQLPLIASESCLSFTLCSTAYTVCTYPSTLYWPQISSFPILQLSLLLIAFYTFLLFVALLLLFSFTPYFYLVHFQVELLFDFYYSLKYFAIYVIL